MSVNQEDKQVVLSLPDGSSATVRLFGATVISWKTKDGKERLYLSQSDKAMLDGPAPIRGGIPLCWPNFGPGPSAAQVEADPLLALNAKLAAGGHQYVRFQTWTFSPSSSTNTASSDSDSVSATFTLPASAAPAPFPQVADLTYTVTLTPTSLTSHLAVKHRESGAEALKFQVAFHNYLSCDAPKAKIHGVPDGQGYANGLKGGAKEVWQGGAVQCGKQTGMSVQQMDLPEGLMLTDEKSGESLKVQWKNLDDVMIFTPGERAGVESWPDMELGDGDKMMCIEPCHSRDWLSLKAGETWYAEQTLTVC